MDFMHADPVWSAHPTLCALAVVVDDVPGMNGDGGRIEALTPRIDRRLASASESEMPEIAAWRDAFSKMGLKPTQYRCAAEALLRRYRKDRSMPRFHPLVDYLNYVSMSFAIPIAAFDCAKISDGITVRPASGAETYESFQGEIENPAPNELIFADRDGHAHSRRWTFRQSARSVVRSETSRALAVAEALHPGARQDIVALEGELRSGLTDAGARVVHSMILTPTERRLEF